MNPARPSDGLPENLSREELLSALFANLVQQQANLALMFLGKTPHPETGESFFDLDAAQLIVEQMEMLRAKTQGNLSPPEAAFIQQTLSALQMAFVEAVNQSGKQPPATPPSASPPSVPGVTAPTSSPAVASDAATATAPAPAIDDESKKKFTKKY